MLAALPSYSVTSSISTNREASAGLVRAALAPAELVSVVGGDPDAAYSAARGGTYCGGQLWWSWGLRPRGLQQRRANVRVRQETP